MHTILRTTVAGLALASLGIASSASAATATAQADAVILAALSVNQVADLDFGSIANNGTGGTATLSAATGAISCSAGLVCNASGTRASFHVDGAANRPVSIQFTDSNIALQGPAPTDLMPLALSTTAGPFVLNGTGDLDFDVGGVLTVDPTESAGTYTGQMEVVVLYN
jgi:hypothetical protein